MAQEDGGRGEPPAPRRRRPERGPRDEDEHGADDEGERHGHARPHLAGAPGEIEVHAVPGGDGGEGQDQTDGGPAPPRPHPRRHGVAEQRRGEQHEEHAGREAPHGRHGDPPDGEVGVSVAQRAEDADEREAADEEREPPGDGGERPVAFLGRAGVTGTCAGRRRAGRVAPAARGRPSAAAPAHRRRGPRAVRRPRSWAGLYHLRRRRVWRRRARPPPSLRQPTGGAGPRRPRSSPRRRRWRSCGPCRDRRRSRRPRTRRAAASPSSCRRRSWCR